MKTYVKIIDRCSENLDTIEMFVTGNKEGRAKLLSLYVTTTFELYGKEYHQDFITYMHFPKDDVLEWEEEEIFNIFVH